MNIGKYLNPRNVASGLAALGLAAGIACGNDSERVIASPASTPMQRAYVPVTATPTPITSRTSTPMPKVYIPSTVTPTPPAKDLLVYAYPETAKPSQKTLNGLLGSDCQVLCPSPPLESLYVYRVDSAISDIVAVHVKNIMNAGYAEKLDNNDFWHGHFVFDDDILCSYDVDDKERRKMWSKLPPGMEKDEWVELYLNSSPYFIYHTRESTGPRFPYQGPPRSIIGTIGGNVYPMTSNTAPNFVSHGTVWTSDFFEFNGERHDGMCDAMIPTKIRLRIGDREFMSYMPGFYILEDSNGRYSLLDGIKFDIYYNIVPLK